MTRPVLLDLFCGAGGAAIGYRRAGFDVLGVDTKPQPDYPGAFLREDWRDVLRSLGGAVYLVHASPPCQGYSPYVSSKSSSYAGTLGQDEPRLIADVREELQRLGKPYVIENVLGAKDDMRPTLALCGTMFGLPIPRHRYIEASFPVPQPAHMPCSGIAARYADERGWDRRDMTVTGKGRRAGTKDRWREVMGWPDDVPVTQHGLREAIPPAYSEHIGRAWMAAMAPAL